MWQHSDKPFPLAQVVTAYDAAAPRYLQQHSSLPLVEQAWLKQAAEFLRPKATTLDVGCGTGLATRYLRSLGMQAIGVDVSIGMLEAASVESGSDAWRLADARELPFSSQSFEMYVAWYSFIHFSAEDICQSLFQATRILMPGGVFIATVHSAWRNDASEYFNDGWLHTDNFLETGRALGFKLIQLEMLLPGIHEAGLNAIHIHRRVGVEADAELPTERLAVIATKSY